jgi:hypothetical protein
VCAPAVKDFAAVRNRSAHTTEDAQPRSQTVMTYSEPSPADLERVLEAALRSSNLPSSAACGYEWITWCSIKVRSTTLADLPTCSDSSRRSCRKQMACKRSGPCLARARRLSRRRGCGTTAGNSEETDGPVRVTVVGEAYSDHGGSRASAERTGGSDARIWWKQHRARSGDN